MCNALLLLLLAVGACLFPAQTPPAEATQNAEQPIKTTLCAIKANPAAFQHKLVEVSGIASHGFEESMFEDLSCFEGMNGAPGIWMEYGGTAGTETMYCCGLTPSQEKSPLTLDGIVVPLVRDSSFVRFDQMLHPNNKPSASVQATVVARIFTDPHSIGQWKQWGYGHMGCCVLLAIQQVISIDSNKPGPSVFVLRDRAKKHPQSSKPRSPVPPQPAAPQAADPLA